MPIDAAHTARPERLRLGMVGGGRDAFIGAVHRIAARIDDHALLRLVIEHDRAVLLERRDRDDSGLELTHDPLLVVDGQT